MSIYILEEYFVAYLKTIRKLSRSSVKHYLDAIKKISSILKEKQLINDSLYEIVDLDRLDEIRDLLRQDDYFVALDSQGHQMYSSGFNNYYRFASASDFENIGRKIELLDSVKAPAPQILQTRQTYKRSSILAKQSIVVANYKCELSSSHNTFIAKSTNHPYMEGHHLLPLSQQHNFKTSLDVYANIICLCPICHRLLHFGTDKDRIQAISKLYEKREFRLENSGIKITKNDAIELAMS